MNKILNISLITNMIKKIYVYACPVQKLVYKKDILIRLNACIFW